MGDHVVLVAEVLSILSPPHPTSTTTTEQEEVSRGLNYMRRSNNRSSDWHDVDDGGDGSMEAAVHGMVYLDGKYRRVGAAIDLDTEVVVRREEQKKKGQQESEVVHRTLGMNIRTGDEGMQ